MISPSFACCALLPLTAALAAAHEGRQPAAAELASEFRNISLDQAQTYRVRDLEISRGDIKLFLNEGVLSFFTPVNGRKLAAFFTVEGSEGGDAEVIVMPPLRSERASLASFTKSPNLDEHFRSALFFFTDETERQILDELNRTGLREAPELAAGLRPRADSIARDIATQIEVPLAQALLDNHQLSRGFFFGLIASQGSGAFDVIYDPTQREPVSLGRVSAAAGNHFQLWTNFRSRRAPQFVEPQPGIHNYRLDVNILPNLLLEAAANFDFQTGAEDGRVIALSLSPRLKVSNAKVDGQPVEVFQRPSGRLAEFGSTETFLLSSVNPFAPGVRHQIELHYAGTMIRRTAEGEYFVDDRSSWYPVSEPTLASFDMTFHCPEHLRLVSTGELVNEGVESGIRTVHRITPVAAALAGFNLGEYSIRREQRRSYTIDLYSTNTVLAALTADPTLLSHTADILDEYTKRWQPLPIHSLAVSPISGYFGQGFPGLIYLSSVSYEREGSRAAALRSSRSDAFFSQLLLPHEIAHQWWGNIVRQADYRSGWITEAMANESALEYIERKNGAAARDDILQSYREDLGRDQDGKTVESAGPLDFGDRLIDTHGLATWHVVLYEKGSWILHMLRKRLGEANYAAMQLRLLRDYASRPLSNDDLRQLVSAFVPASQPDRSLTAFFDTWVYGTGIPTLALHGRGRSFDLELSGVDNDFLADIPLRCKGAPVHWVRAGSGSNIVELPNASANCELPSPHDFLYFSR